MDLSEFAQQVYDITSSICEESTHLELYEKLMQISELAQLHAIIPVPEQNYIIDNKTSPSVILCISVVSKRVTQVGLSYAGALCFNSEHSGNLSSRLPSDIVTLNASSPSNMHKVSA